MQVPLEITYRGLEKTPDIDKLVREKAAKLEKVCDYITSCRVAVELTQQRQRLGSPYRVRVELRVPPGHDLVVKREGGPGDQHDPLHAIIRDVFNTARRQLNELVEKQRGQVKVHPENETQALVVRLFRDQDYGFIKTLDGRDIYFHRNAVLNDDFDRLEIGTGVRFVETEGEKGPQASTVQIVDKPGSSFSDSERAEMRPEAPLGWRE